MIEESFTLRTGWYEIVRMKFSHAWGNSLGDRF